MTDIWGATATQQKADLTSTYDSLYRTLQSALYKHFQNDLEDVKKNSPDKKQIDRMQDQLNRLGTEKDSAADAVNSFKSSKNTAQNIIDQLNTAYAAVQSGKTSAFNSALVQVNILAGSRGAGLENLVGNVRAGNTGEMVKAINIGTGINMLNVRSLGLNFTLTDSATGDTYKPNFEQQTLSIKGATVNFSDLSFVSRDTSNNTITLQNKTDSTNYTVKYHQGGLPIGPSFLYGDLSNADSKAAALADIKASIQIAHKTYNDLSNTDLAAEGASKILTNKIDTLNKTLVAKSKEINGEREAQRTAAQTRFQITSKNLAFAARMQRQMLAALIRPENPFHSSNVFSIISNSQSNQSDFFAELTDYRDGSSAPSPASSSSSSESSSNSAIASQLKSLSSSISSSKS